MAAPEAPTETPLTAEQVFDDLGPSYETAFADLPAQAASLQWLLSRMPGPAAGGTRARIVDLGCGTGRPVASTLAAAGHDVLGVDISAAMVAAARERVPAARFEQADAREFLRRPGQAGTYDAATAYFSLIAGVTQAEIRAAVAGVFALLQPGGLFVFATVPLPAEELPIRWMGRPVVVSSLAPEEAVACVAAAGFVVEHDALSRFTPRAAEAGICGADDVWEEPHLFVYARKPETE